MLDCCKMYQCVKLPLRMSHSGPQPSSMKRCFYLRVFKVNLNQDNYSAVLPSLLPPPHKLFLHRPPLPSLPPLLLAALSVPCDAAFRLGVHQFSSFRPPCSSSPLLCSLFSRPQSSQSFPQPSLPPFCVSFVFSHSSSLYLLLCQDPSCEPLR